MPTTRATRPCRARGSAGTSASERIGEFLPTAVFNPPADRRIPQEQFDVPEVFELRHGRVDAEELDREPVLLQEIAHRVLVEGPPRAAPRLLPMVSMMSAEDEHPARPEGPRRVPHDFGGHAQVADHRVDRVAGEFVVGRLLDVADDEFHVPDVADPGVSAGLHELHPVQIHADDAGPDRRHDEGQPALSRADVQDAPPAKILVAKLLEEHRSERVRISRRISPGESAANADDVGHRISALRIARGTIRGLRWTSRKSTRL